MFRSYPGKNSYGIKFLGKLFIRHFINLSARENLVSLLENPGSFGNRLSRNFIITGYHHDPHTSPLSSSHSLVNVGAQSVAHPRKRDKGQSSKLLGREFVLKTFLLR